MQKLNFIKKILFTKREVDVASCVLVHDIKKYYKDVRDEVFVLVILDGAKSLSDFMFSRCWLGGLNKFNVKYITAKSYTDGKKSHTLDIDYCNVGDVAGWVNKHVLLVDDIYDSGHTLDSLKEFVNSFNPKDVQCAVLLERNKPHKYDVDVKFVGLKVDMDGYLVGCGLDYDNKYRDLPYIAVIKEEKDKYWDPDIKEVYEICLCNN